MANLYVYNGETYNTEAEAQSAVADLKVRFDNNPTDYMVVQEITANGSGWNMPLEELTDDEILSPDSSKTFSAYSKISGENSLPLTSAELNAKRTEYLAAYAEHCDCTNINVYRVVGQILFDGYTISTNIDMSGYL